jgi:hypothetical protein
MTLYKLGNEAKINRSNVLNDRDSRQVSKFIMEEIYQSKECNGPDPNKNVHKAYKEGDRFYFNFPEPWFNIPTLNKAVALRRITTKARAYDFGINFYLYRDDEGSATWPEHLLIDVVIHVRPTDDIETALSNICLTINRAIKNQITKHPAYLLPEEWPEVHYLWDEDTYVAKLNWFQNLGVARTKQWMIVCNDLTPDFAKLFNSDFVSYHALDCSLVGAYMTWDWFERDNVWDRRELFIHSSFVTYTSFRYLGRSGEFYTKPSKIYDFQDSSSRLFYFQVSFDGMKIITLRHEYFIVELSLILDSRRYQSE